MPTKDEVKIAAQPQMNPDVCRFTVNHRIYDGFFDCRSKDIAKGSPLLEALFNIPGVSEVLVSGSTLTIAKTSSEEWQALGQQIGVTIRSQIQGGGVLIEANKQAKLPPTDDKIRQQVQKILEEEINPSLASHGGFVKLNDMRGTVVYLTLQGGCQGCASASYTLRNGIERILKARVPEVTEVVDVTDHSSGHNPYF